MEEFVVDAEDAPVAIDGGPYLVALLARMIGGDQVFTTIFDPFDRLTEFQCGGADQHIFRIQLAADAEAAADMALVEMDGFSFAAKHLRERIAIPMRHLGGAVHFQHVLGLVVARDGAARFQRHAAVAAYGKVELDNRGR